MVHGGGTSVLESTQVYCPYWFISSKIFYKLFFFLSHETIVTMTQLLKRIRENGIVPPLLLHDSIPEPEDGFDSSVMNLLDSCNNGES